MSTKKLDVLPYFLLLKKSDFLHHIAQSDRKQQIWKNDIKLDDLRIIL